MKLFKLLLSVVGATALLGALVTTASAAHLSNSSERFRSVFANVTFSGGFGTTECALTLEGTLHSKTITKTIGSLIGAITGATVAERCRRGSATILRASLPWHVTYSGFEGTLPAIRKIFTTVTGSEFQIREPVGITCLAPNATNEGIYSRNTTTGEIAEVTIQGEDETSCGIPGRLSGRETNVTDGAGHRITVTLI